MHSVTAVCLISMHNVHFSLIRKLYPVHLPRWTRNTVQVCSSKFRSDVKANVPKQGSATRKCNVLPHLELWSDPALEWEVIWSQVNICNYMSSHLAVECASTCILSEPLLIGSYFPARGKCKACTLVPLFVIGGLQRCTCRVWSARKYRTAKQCRVQGKPNCPARLM